MRTKTIGYPTKIATCCYCGTKAALVLGRDRHELACSACGAPLHDLKRLPEHHPGKRELVQPSAVRKAAKPKKRKVKTHKARYKTRKKGFFREFLEEAFDVLEDVFD